MHVRRGLALTVVALTLAACGSAAGSSAPPLTAPPSHYLLTIDQLVTPDFTVAEATHMVDAHTLSGGDSALQQQMHNDGFRRAARVAYFRQVELATSNGPLEVIATVESFADAGGAHQFFATDVDRLDSLPDQTPVSAGSIGDEAHADSQVSTAPGGISVVQVTLEWRVSNLLNVLVVRGRYGGTRLDDALILAHRMTAKE
jgi:hypothetical protein